MKKVTEYDILRKAQYLAQQLTELSKGFDQESPAGLATKINTISSLMPTILILASNDTTLGYLNRIRRVIKDNESLIRLLLLARDKGYMSFGEWKRWCDELDLFGKMLVALSKSISYQSESLSLSFTSEFYLK